ncbi:alpha/beta-hydrolase [Coprinopsis marcescibilis]|uniref:Alpha/beta-hydrolase n=1 Tax=Coprinopsis marcescibilis TaxID=230819 RepID=A0A5C3L710_COPMA|nr:alpha/beta-hydrolase [Coprinopsis marcescibilis]
MFVQVSCPSGTHDFAYSIATPTSASATTIEPDLPSVLFIHSGYAAQEVFESQFSDPQLRRFNLVAVDLLGNGSTRGFVGTDRYTPAETAVDLKLVIDALGLPACHVFGLSLGSTVGLELAWRYPSYILSLTICSPITPTETADVAAGRAEVFECWSETFKLERSDEDEGSVRQKQQELLNDMLCGASQLVNNEHSRLAYALGVCGMVRSIDIWSGTKEKLKKSHDSCIRWFTERKAIPTDSLAQIKCPVQVVHCSEDVGYSVEVAEALRDELKAAGIAVSLYSVSGPHYGNFTHPQAINPLLRDIVLSVSVLEADALPAPEPAFDNGKMETPWTELFMRFGYDPRKDTKNNGGCGFDSPESVVAPPVFGSWFDISPVVPEQRTQPYGAQ